MTKMITTKLDKNLLKDLHNDTSVVWADGRRPDCVRLRKGYLVFDKVFGLLAHNAEANTAIPEQSREDFIQTIAALCPKAG